MHGVHIYVLLLQFLSYPYLLTMTAMDLVLQMSTDAQKIYLSNIQDLQHKPFHLTHGMSPVEDDTARFLNAKVEKQRHGYWKDTEWKGIEGGNENGTKFMKEGDDKLFSMFWESQKQDQDWLKKCAIGVLKKFDEISKVNNRLSAEGTFVVNVEEERNPVDMQWLESFLALRKTQEEGFRTARSEKEEFQICVPRTVGEVSTLSLAKHDKTKSGHVEKCQFKSLGTKVRKVLEKQKKKDERDMVFVVKGVFEKGKQKSVSRKAKRPMTFVLLNGKLDLGKRKGYDKGGVSSSDESSSTSEEGCISKFFLDSHQTFSSFLLSGISFLFSLSHLLIRHLDSFTLAVKDPPLSLPLMFFFSIPQ
ncbi:hypothetical protein Dsin_022992 [Dipteronia sinensis]|uniref:Uncharacterized protein n=1 Tax=Dipteronia sinensis TaxID=43782 RepID=A0AAE0A3E9_9ROSI|nr:hypothetical protein Dsin_022992 [Dipteronia sinensis]